MKFPLHGIAVLGLLVAAIPAAATAQADDYVAPADELAAARAIMEVMFPATNREDAILEMATAMGQQAAASMMNGPIFEEPGIKAIVEKHLSDMPQTLRPLFAKHLPQIFEATAVAYTREFSLEELRDIAAFAQTPSGQRYFVTLQKLLGDPVVAAANQAMFKDIGPIQREQSAKVSQEVQEYLIANPDVIERLRKVGVGQAK